MLVYNSITVPRNVLYLTHLYILLYVCVPLLKINYATVNKRIFLMIEVLSFKTVHLIHSP